MTTPWPTARIADVVEPVRKQDPGALGLSSFRYIDIGSVDGGKHEIVSAAEIRAVDAPSRARQQVRAHDTVFSTVRPYLEKIAYVDDHFDGDVASTGFCVLRPRPDRVVPRFLFHFMTSRHLLDQVLPLQRGVSYPAVRDRDVLAASILLPSIDDQRRIVDILEDHLSRLDAADTLARQSSRRLKSLDEAVVIRHLLPGAELQRNRLGAIASGDLPSLPSQWRWSELGNVADVVGGVTKDAKRQGDPSYVEVPYLRVANVQRARLDLSVVTTIRVPPAKAAALRLRHGDVLMNEGGDRDKLARGWVWREEIEDCIHQNHVFRARPDTGQVLPEWLAWCANTYGARWAQRHGRQSVNLASISLSTIRRLPIPVAPLAYQERSLAEIAAIRDQNDALGSALDGAHRRGAALRRALLTAAFSGRLTGHASDVDRAEELAFS